MKRFVYEKPMKKKAANRRMQERFDSMRFAEDEIVRLHNEIAEDPFDSGNDERKGEMAYLMDVWKELFSEIGFAESNSDCCVTKPYFWKTMYRRAAMKAEKAKRIEKMNGGKKYVQF